MTALSVIPIPAFKDNYFWLMHDGVRALVVDPGAAEPVVQVLDELGLELCAILLTHLHYDHCWGVPGLLQQWQVPVIGPALNEHDRNSHPPFPRPGTVPLDCVTQVIGQGDHVRPPGLEVDLAVIAVPGHTKGHVVYWDQAGKRVFTGDTLFAGGCGKVFGGSMSAMVDSLNRLANLPDETQVYCAHEYTLSNLNFALMVDPHNPALHRRIRDEQAKREKGEPTLPTTIGLERSTNPFLRVLEPDILESLHQKRGVVVSTQVESFEALRYWKNSF